MSLFTFALLIFIQLIASLETSPPAFQPSETWGRTQFQSKPCSSVSSYDQQRKANPAIFLGFDMKIKTILEMAFPHCIVRSFHYARVSLPASVTGPRDGLCALGAGLPGSVLPSLRCTSLRACCGGPHVACPRPSSTAAQVRGHFVGSVVFIRQSCGRSCLPGALW